MNRRTVWAAIVVLAGTATGLWLAFGPFTMTRVVQVDPPAIHNDFVTPEMASQGVPANGGPTEMTIRCARGSDGHYVTTDGEMMFFNEATGSPESPQPLCGQERSTRRWLGLACLTIGGICGTAILVDGRRRAASGRHGPTRIVSDKLSETGSTERGPIG